MKIAFVTPAYMRYEISRFVFAQHAWAHRQLAELGILATSVVVANDENITLAKDHGFHVVERPNDFLGARFNAGHHAAFTELDVDYTIPVGSDTWVSPRLVTDLLDGEPVFSTNQRYTVFHKTGTRRADMVIDWGVLQAFSRKSLERCDFKPCRRQIKRGCDTSARYRVMRHNDVTVEYVGGEPFDVVAFQSGVQVTSFNNLAVRWKAAVAKADVDTLFKPLYSLYPSELVDQAVGFYKEGVEYGRVA